MVNKDISVVLRYCEEVAQLCKEAISDNNKVSNNNAKIEAGQDGYTFSDYAYPDTKLRATLKRRSMDLTRSLAQLRRP